MLTHCFGNKLECFFKESADVGSNIRPRAYLSGDLANLPVCHKYRKLRLCVLQKLAHRGQLWKGKQNVFNKNDVIVIGAYYFNFSTVITHDILKIHWSFFTSTIWRQNILEPLHLKLLRPLHFLIRFSDRIRLFCTVYKLPF